MSQSHSSDSSASKDGRRRFVHSAPVPLESDSDSDFNPGTYVHESPKRKRGSKTDVTANPSSAKGHKRRRETLERIPARKRHKKAPSKAASSSQNPLLEYFSELADDLGLESAPEDEAAEAHEDDDLQTSSTSEQDDVDENPPILRSLVALSQEMQRESRSGTDDSVTEPETDPEDAQQTKHTPRSTTDPPAQGTTGSRAPSAKAGAPDVAEESVTEPETDDDVLSIPRPVPTASTGTGAPRQDSVTESESDVENDGDDVTTVTHSKDQPLHPKPEFALKAGQSLLGSLVLNNKHKVPGHINTFLREYQRDGVRFFWDHYLKNTGCLLGDDMGLGKTIQVISFLSAIMQKYGDERDIDRRRKQVSDIQDISLDWKSRKMLPPANSIWPTCLIIAPSSVVGNWEREFETWGYFEVGTYMGSPSERAEVLNDFKMGRLDVVVTSFDVARRDIALLDDLAWSCIIVDEVHRVKNPRSKLTAAFNSFECPVRIGLTGTAIQNSYMELWTILNWTNPGSVGTKGQWEGYVVRPLTTGQSKSASNEEHMKAAMVAKILKEKLLPRFFLRRTKSIIQDQLPKKLDQVVFCPLTPKQTEVYKRIINNKAVQNLVHKDDPCDCGSREKRRKCCHPLDKGDLFKYMSTLIKISNHLALILPSPSDTPEQTARNRELCQIAFAGESIPKYGPAMLVPRFCGKWMVLESLLKDWKKDLSNKVLIFTKSVKLLEMLEYHLGSQNIGFVKLDGSTKQPERMGIIDRFHEDPDIFAFLISTLAGGTGLNLTGANKVVIFDPNWNPAHDLQAMDRAYRFGQTRDVQVFRLLGAGSIEELIYARQVYKQQQMLVGYNASLQTRYFEGVQGEKRKQGELFGIKNIFKLHEDTLATKQAIERASLVDLDWALAHMDAKKKKSSQAGEEWVYEAEAKTGKEYGELRGLGALLFDDDAPKLADKDSDIQKTLNDVGVGYIHRNEDLIVESTVERQRVRALIAEKKKAKRKPKDEEEPLREKTPEPEWPPKRKHHKAPPSPKSKQNALVQLGMIRDASDLTEFAQQFSRKPQEEQRDLLAQLDAHARKSRDT